MRLGLREGVGVREVFIVVVGGLVAMGNPPSFPRGNTVTVKGG